MESRVQRHIKAYVIRNASLYFGIAYFISLIFAIVWIVYKRPVQDLIMAELMMLVPTTVVFAISLLNTIRFKRMILDDFAIQNLYFEKRYRLQNDDHNHGWPEIWRLARKYNRHQPDKQMAK